MTLGRIQPRPGPINSVDTLSISATKVGRNVNITLTENINGGMYTRTFPCTVDDDQTVAFPIDLTVQVQHMMIAVCQAFLFPSSYEGDS